MIKISALNEESEEESGSEGEITKGALEQIALQQYAKALELQRKGNLKEATQLLKDLLDTELLYDVKKPAPGENAAGPLFNVKYLSYKNLASMLSASDDVDAAIEAYCAASELDDTDITLWHRLGQLCMRGKRYEMALNAFQRGIDRNPRHWPCLDKIVTLLLGLGYKKECIAAIHEALQLDPGYLRGIAYRRHIYTNYRYIRDYMEYLNPIYKWDEKEDEAFDEKKAEILIKEAGDIHEIFLEQQRAEQFKYVLPELKLVKPISNLNWLSVGDSLVHMHNYMSEHYYSHACRLELIFEKGVQEVPMEVCEEPKEVEPVQPKPKPEVSNMDVDKNVENVLESDNNDLSDKDKATIDTEKTESDVETQTESKTKKQPARRRGSAVSRLKQWEWCSKRRSGRKKNKHEQDDNIYEILRKMVPICLSPDMIQKKENQVRDGSPDTADIDKLFEEKEKPEEKEHKEYFGSETEQKDVKSFISRYTHNKNDIIDILKDYLSMLAGKWQEKWPMGLSDVFIKANKCYMSHVDLPSCTSEDHEDLVYYTTVNILVEEFSVNDKLLTPLEERDKQMHDISVTEAIGMILCAKPHIFTECMQLTLRFLWVKLHTHLLNKSTDLALDCLYQLQYEFDAMGEHHDTYNLNIVNFTYKPFINENDITTGIQFLERKKKLSIVLDLFDKGNYEEVLSIVIDSFEFCKTAKNEEEEISLDFAIQLCIILDSYWALNKIEQCLKWSLICLHEGLKHYFRYTTGSQEYDKWTLAVVKVLCCMEHILSTEGLSCLDSVSQKELSQGLEDLIRIIGHQVETNASDMPFDTVAPWIIMHYILQREEDQGRIRLLDNDKLACDEIPNPLLVLFIAHEQLGNRGWCCKSEGKLLYFILDTVVPRLRSPSLSKPLEQVCQHVEQCVYCLFGHPSKKSKLKYLVDHNATPFALDWKRAQLLYEIFKPPLLPRLEGKVPGITADTEQLFHKILALLPAENNPAKYLPEIEKYIKGVEDKLPNIPPLIPYKMKDIYYLLGDYYYKKEEGKLGIKYNMLDVAVNNDRFESWAEISLAKVMNLDRILNSCKNLNNEREYLNPAKSVIRCFKRALELVPTHYDLWIEYGLFVYIVHSFCSRLLKQASESLSMEDFESLEQQKEDLLDTAHKCFITVINVNDKKESERVNEESWRNYYMLGKVAEKRNKPPSVYLDYYMKAVKCLQETDATYPLKIHYNTSNHLCIEVLELHYRIHASILKYIEQHENKPIAASIGKVFSVAIEEWKKGPFTKKSKKEGVSATEATLTDPKPPEAVHAANILKRSVSDAGEEDTHEAKRLKMESAAAKVRRSASYDTERMATNKDSIVQNSVPVESTAAVPVEENKQEVASSENKPQPPLPQPLPPPPQTEANKEQSIVTNKSGEEKREETDTEKKGESSSSTSSSSSSDSSSSESSSDSSSDSSRDSGSSSKSSNDTKALTDEEIMKIISSCLDALEDCTSRFPLHYKSLYRLAHYHFYYEKGKDIERCRDLMLSNFISRAGQKLGGLFSERRNTNFFNNIWKMPPAAEVERAGGFTFHMNRSVLLTLEILKEIDDYKTLLDISISLQKIPEPDKKYLRDSDREELAQQAFSLCVQSLKSQLIKFSQQADIKSNDVERQGLKSFMLDIYKAYQRIQKQPNSKQFTNLLIDGYKLITTEPIAENANLVDISLRYCHRLKQEATMVSIEKSQNAQKKQAAKAAAAAAAAVAAEAAKATTTTPAVVHPTKPDQLVKPPAPQTTPSTSGSLPKMSPHEMAAAFQSYLPMLNDSVLSQQTAAALSLSYLSNFTALANYTSMQSSLQNTLQNSFQAEFYRQFIGQSFSSFMPPVKKQKRGPKPGQTRPQSNPQMNKSKSFSGPTMPTTSKAQPTPVISSLQKSNSTSLTPSMGTVLQNLPASMSANLSTFGAHPTSLSIPTQAHMSSASTVNAAIHTKPPMPHQQVSPGKTLQEKLAERQKHLPISKNQDINASISKLPSSLTITKTSVPKPAAKKPEAKKALPFSNERPKPITTNEVIVLDDD